MEFAAGTDEANALVDALASSKNFKAEAIKSGAVTLQNVSQSQFTKGTDPQVTNGDYSNAFKQVEAYEFNKSASIPRILRYICFCRASSIVFLMRHPLHRRSLLRSTR